MAKLEFLSRYVEEATEQRNFTRVTLGQPRPPGDSRWRRVAARSFYVAQPEVWGLVLEHRLHSELLGETVAGQDIPGVLLRESPRPGVPIAQVFCVFA